MPDNANPTIHSTASAASSRRTRVAGLDLDDDDEWQRWGDDLVRAGSEGDDEWDAASLAAAAGDLDEQIDQDEIFGEAPPHQLSTPAACDSASCGLARAGQACLPDYEVAHALLESVLRGCDCLPPPPCRDEDEVMPLVSACSSYSPSVRIPQTLNDIPNFPQT